MFTAKQYFGPLWQGFFLTAAFCLLSFDSAKAVTEQSVDYSPTELEELVGPVALYPDDLIAIILPASSYPLQIVEAARYLEEHETNPELKPDADWDDAVVALLNYPEVIDLMNEDLDWTWNLGEAVVNQPADVLDAIQDFRGRAIAAGNFESDDRQTISQVDDVIEVTPVDPEVIYVPYYEPSRVVVYQRWPVYYYYPHAYPVYYYPYPVHYSFASGFFWGVTTAYTIGWLTDRVHFHYYGYASHPYYGHHYTSHYDARYAGRVRHRHYEKSRSHVVYDRQHYGNTWQPRQRHGDRPGYRREATDGSRMVASNFTGSAPSYSAAGDTRTSVRSSRNERSRLSRETRNPNALTQSDNRRGQADDARTNSRVAVLDRSGDKIASGRNRITNSRTGSNQIIDTRSDRRSSARPAARTPHRADETANTTVQTPRQTRRENTARPNRATPRENDSTAAAQRAAKPAQPRQERRQASRVPQSNKSSESKARSANTAKSQAGSQSTTRVASAARTPSGGGQFRGGRSGMGRGHRK